MEVYNGVGVAISTSFLNFGIGHTPRWITAITLRLTKALAVLTLNGSLGSSVRVHRDSETTERRYGAHLAYKGSTSNRHNEVRCWKPVLSRVGIAALRAELQHRLNCDPKDLEFLPDVLLRHGFAQTLNQEPCASVLGQTIGVKGHTLACFDGPQHPDRGPEAVGSVGYKDELVALYSSTAISPSLLLEPLEEGPGVLYT